MIFNKGTQNMPRFLNPATVPTPSSRYTQAIAVASTSKRLIISGQVGMKPDGTILHGLEAQTEQVFDNILALVAAADMEMTDIVKIVTYCTVPGQLSVIREIRQRKFGNHAPASTLLIVAGLANPEFLIEIEAEALRESES